MFPIIRRELRANLKSIVIWGVCMLFMALAGFGEYDVVITEGSASDLTSIVDVMPRILQVMFGMGVIPISTAAGWYVCMFLWCSLIAYVHAALLGATILSKEERDKTSEFLFTRPVKRSTVVSAKMVAAALNSLFVVFIAWVGTLVVFSSPIRREGGVGDVAITLADVHATMLGMYLTALVFLFLGFCLSAVFSGRGKAAQYASAVVLATYFVSVAIEMLGEVDEVAAISDYLCLLSPFRYFDPARMLQHGFELAYLLLATALVVAMGYITFRAFGKRNLHG